MNFHDFKVKIGAKHAPVMEGAVAQVPAVGGENMRATAFDQEAELRVKQEDQRPCRAV
jgi:hypothetical protein